MGIEPEPADIVDQAVADQMRWPIK